MSNRNIKKNESRKPRNECARAEYFETICPTGLFIFINVQNNT